MNITISTLLIMILLQTIMGMNETSLNSSEVTRLIMSNIQAKYKVPSALQLASNRTTAPNFTTDTPELKLVSSTPIEINGKYPSSVGNKSMVHRSVRGNLSSKVRPLSQLPPRVKTPVYAGTSASERKVFTETAVLQSPSSSSPSVEASEVKAFTEAASSDSKATTITTASILSLPTSATSVSKVVTSEPDAARAVPKTSRPEVVNPTFSESNIAFAPVPDSPAGAIKPSTETVEQQVIVKSPSVAVTQKEKEKLSAEVLLQSKPGGKNPADVNPTVPLVEIKSPSSPSSEGAIPETPRAESLNRKDDVPPEEQNNEATQNKPAPGPSATNDETKPVISEENKTVVEPETPKPTTEGEDSVGEARRSTFRSRRRKSDSDSADDTDESRPRRPRRSYSKRHSAEEGGDEGGEESGGRHRRRRWSAGGSSDDSEPETGLRKRRSFRKRGEEDSVEGDTGSLAGERRSNTRRHSAFSDRKTSDAGESAEDKQESPRGVGVEAKSAPEQMEKGAFETKDATEKPAAETSSVEKASTEDASKIPIEPDSRSSVFIPFASSWTIKLGVLLSPCIFIPFVVVIHWHRKRKAIEIAIREEQAAQLNKMAGVV